MILEHADGPHGEYTTLMSLVLDDEATAAEAARLRGHLVSCEACARTWQRWQELDRKFDLAPVVPAPMDFSLAVAARIDEYVAEHTRRRWFMVGLGVAAMAAMLVAVIALAVSNGWHLVWLQENGPLNAAWTGLASMGGWIVRAVLTLVEQAGMPTVAAGAGVLLCVTCVLATVWLWLVARWTPTAQSYALND